MATEAPVHASVGAALRTHAYEVLQAQTFTQGRKLLVDRRPDVLVTTVRLREHNGLHLAIVSRISSALTKTIVIGYADSVLEAEARQVGAVYLIDPTPGEIVAAVEGAMRRHERRWPRVRANLSAVAADEEVRLLDLSYGGFRIELAAGSRLTTGETFDLTVGSVRVVALPIWLKEESTGAHVWCGATLDGDAEQNAAWRAIVDDALDRGRPVA